MRKFYLLFALLIGISSAAWADSFSPTEGAVYVIKVINNENGTNVDYYATYNASATSGSNNVLTAARKNALTVNSFFVIEAIDGDGATNGFTIRLKSGDTRRYVYAINTNGGGGDNGNANVGTKVVSESEIPDDCKWQINVVSEGIYNIIPKSGSASWNVRGTAGGYKAIGQWTSTGNQNCKWYIQTPADLASECATQYTFENKVAFPAESWVNKVNSATTNATTLNTTWSTDNASAFVAAWNTYFSGTAVLQKPTSTSNLYRIKNVATGKYWYQDDESISKRLTLANDGANNPKYYWLVNFSADSNNMTISGSTGGIRRGNTNAAFADIDEDNAVSFPSVTLAKVASGTESYTENQFNFPNVHTTAQTAFTIKNQAYNSETNPYYVTTWANTQTNNTYIFEPVALEDGKHIYTVNVTGLSLFNSDAYVTLNIDGYTGNKTVRNGGFFILSSSEAVAENFSAVNVLGDNNYDANVSISGNTINVTYSVNTVNQAQTCVNASAANKVGYPNSGSTVATELTAAWNNYQTSPTEENLSALSEKMSAYKTSTSDISMPVDGKAYTFTSVSYNGTKRYINYTTAGLTLSYVASKATPFICRKIEEGKYAFVNNDGKYLIWKGSNDGQNGNKGYADAYDQSFTKNNVACTDWAKFTIIKLTQNNSNIQSGITNADLTGYVSIKARRTNSNNSYIIVTNSSNSFNQAGENDTYFNSSHSTALLMEEVPYANTVKLQDASSLESGKSIGTFSAPFPTVVPENTTAYSVKTQLASDVTEVSTYKVAEAGQAIPANTGVILLGTDAQVTMLPRTTETTVEIAEGALGNSAGAAKDITSENSYVLSKQSSTWAFYKVGTGATALPMNKAYLVLPNGTSEGVIRFNFGNTTGMELVGADAAAAQGKVYDLSGREVKVAAKGLYIVGGKKVIVK